MAIDGISEHDPVLEEWADRHPVASGAMATALTGVLATASAADLMERPTIVKALTTAALGLITVGGAVETVRPNTFRLWERMEARFNRD